VAVKPTHISSDSYKRTKGWKRKSCNWLLYCPILVIVHSHISKLQ